MGLDVQALPPIVTKANRMPVAGLIHLRFILPLTASVRTTEAMSVEFEGAMHVSRMSFSAFMFRGKRICRPTYLPARALS